MLQELKKFDPEQEAKWIRNELEKMEEDLKRYEARTIDRWEEGGVNRYINLSSRKVRLRQRLKEIEKSEREKT